MTLRNQSRNDRYRSLCGLAAAVGVGCMLSMAGCGSGVANALPDVTKPLVGVPSGPVLGYVFSSADGTLRALLGVRGSSQVSASIVAAGTYVAGEVSTASSTALLEDGGGSLFAFALPSAQPVHVTDGLPAGVRVVFAPSGKTAIAYAAGGSTISLISGLPAAPVMQTIGVPASSALASAAVSDAGTIVMATGGTPLSIGTLSAKGQFARFASVGTNGGFSFLTGADDMLIADGSANTVSLIRNVGSGASVQALSVAGLNHPLAIAASQDGKWAVIANGGDAGLLRVDLSSGTAAAKILCGCQPSQLSALAGGSTFRVNALYSGPLWTVDLTMPTPQLLFVPAIAKGTP